MSITTPRDPFGLVGVTIDGKYTVERVAGEGGFAVVYRAFHEVWKKPVAIKCFKALVDSSASVRESLLQSFIQEGSVLTELSGRSAHIVQARDIGTLTTPSGAWVPFMVLEWLEGGTLEALMARHSGHPWPFPWVLSILGPVAEALDVAHLQGVVHRDVKPGNVFLVGPQLEPGDSTLRSCHVKLLDFGIAKVAQEAAERGITGRGGPVAAFTAAYGAPEQYSRARGATGPWTDVYALALMVSEMLSGRPALEGNDILELGLASADPLRRPTPRKLGAQVSDDTEAVMRRALAVRPEDRFARAGDFWDALRISFGERPVFGEPGQPPTESFPATAVGDTGRAVDLSTLVRTALAPTQRTSGTPASPSSRRLRRVGAVAVVAVVASLSFLLVQRWRTLPPPIPSGTAAVPSTSLSSTAAIVELSVEATPPQAVIYIDGEPRPQNPVSTLLVADGARHRVRVEAKGFLSHEEDVQANRDSRLRIALQATTPSSTPPPTPVPRRTLPPAPTAVVSALKPNCNPPFYVDSAGIRRGRPGCLE